MTGGGSARKRVRPFLKIKHGSAFVPVFKWRVRKWDCCTLGYHMKASRMERNFRSLHTRPMLRFS